MPDLATLGWDDTLSAAFEPHGREGLAPGRVAVQHRGEYDVLTAEGERRSRITSRLRRESRREELPVVGDWVALDPAGAIAAVLPRRTTISRRAAHEPASGVSREQVIAANVDHLLVIGSLKHPVFSSSRTDRILAACVWHEIPATLVLNKIDLADAEDVAAIRATYEAIPIEVLETSAKDGRGIDRLAAVLKDRISVLYGPSGAGKSTLANRVQPGLDLKEGKISRYWQQGRHTTTSSQLHALALGGWIVDTPGIRVFRLHGVRRNVLRDLFPDFERFQRECRFDGCTHDHEPECMVADAVETGRLSGTRYASYLEMLDELDPDLAPDLSQADEDGHEAEEGG